MARPNPCSHLPDPSPLALSLSGVCFLCPGTMRARRTAGFAFSADPITLEAERRRIMYNTARYTTHPHTPRPSVHIV